MRSLTLALLFILLNFLEFTPALAADVIPESFKGFKLIYLFGPKEGAVYIDPNLKYKLSEQSTTEEYGRYIHFTARGDKIEVKYSPGPSEDPTYIIEVQNAQKKTKPTEIIGERLFITAAGDFYVDGNIDYFYNARRKYTITDHRIIEVRQPFYLVELVCEVNAPVMLTTERCGRGDKIAALTEGMKIKVLVAESPDNDRSDRTCPTEQDVNASLLVATPFGLVGWAQAGIGSMYNPGRPISCLRFVGD